MADAFRLRPDAGEAPSQINLFAMAARESAAHKQTENAVNTTETLMLVQAAIMLGTAAVVVWYTVETRRLRATAAAQFEMYSAGRNEARS